MLVEREEDALGNDIQWVSKEIIRFGRGRDGPDSNSAHYGSKENKPTIHYTRMVCR